MTITLTPNLSLEKDDYNEYADIAKINSNFDKIDAAFVALTPTGITGATAATRFVGATATGSPITGSFVQGDFVIAQDGRLWICTAAGTPGTWVALASLSSSTPNPIGAASAGVGSTASRSDHVHAQQSAVSPVGIAGATTATRFVGGTTTGAPSTGTFNLGDFAVAQNGHIWICTSAGTPGTWTDAGSGSGVSLASTTPNAIGTAAVGVGSTAARSDHVHAQQAAVTPTTLTGATTATRYVGGVSGAAPSTGTFSTGDYVVDATNGDLWICTAGGSPGTWSNTFTAPYQVATGLTGATTSTRWVGGTTGGPPVSGTFSTGDFTIGTNGGISICTAGGSPGSWVTLTRTSITPQAIGTAAVGTDTTGFARPDHVHAQQAAVTPTTLTGATAASRYVGAVASVAPTTGTFAVGDYVIAQSGLIFICTGAGSPGTWTAALAPLTATTPSVIGTAAVGTALTAARADHVHAQQAAVTPTTLTGAASASRYVGATTSGAPASGTFAVGDFIVAQNGHMFVCTAAGSPGTWVDVAGGAGVSLTANTPQPIGTAAVGTGTAAARDDHVHAQQAAIQPGSALNAGVTTGGRFVGQAGTAPSSGTFLTGDFVVDANGAFHICTAGGTPGTWRDVGAVTISQTPLAIGTAAMGSAVAAARADHVHPQQAAVAPTGGTGATSATRFVGGTTTGAPASGTWAVGDFAVAQNGHIWVCTSAGTPGTWVDVSSFAVQTSRQIISGTGLSGGGDLSADRTLAVSYGTTSGTAAQGNDARFTTITATTQATAYTLVLADAGTVVESTNASAMAITVPPNSSVAFPIGTVIELHQYGAGQVTITPGAAVTIRTSTSLTTRAQYSTARIRKRATDEWVADGDLT